MKKYIGAVLIGLYGITLPAQQIITGEDADRVIHGTSLIRYSGNRPIADYIRLDEEAGIPASGSYAWMLSNIRMSPQDELLPVKSEKDVYGMEHTFYQHYVSGIRVENSIYKTHCKDGKLVSLNGQLYTGIPTNTTPAVSAEAAIQSAIGYVGAEVYKWQLPGEEKFIQLRTGDANATFYPQPELCIAPVKGNYLEQDFRLCWKMEIYAHSPLSRQYIYVDAATGEVIWTQSRIFHTDTPGTAHTAYSGTRNIVTDSFAGGFRLRESGRGGGVETYDLNNTTDYGSAVDFTDSDNNWISPTPAIDQYALDAHWGAEMTYDYYLNEHSINSIDNNGLPLVSYVHYDTGYENAFWNGSEMTYGDGVGTTEPLTTIDITGHEITHGLTQFTAGLIYQDESGALNESFSDIFGVTIDHYARGTTGDSLWRMGEECFTPNGIRLMSNPSEFGDPECYLGSGWIDAGGPDNGGVHTNSGVQNYWYYLMCQGGSGVNNNFDSYNVTGIGMEDASRIAFRNLTVYLNASSGYEDARFYAIIAAEDIFGPCSPQVETTTNAWYAVGVGDAYYDGVQADFVASGYNICTLPRTVSFTNTSLSGHSTTTYHWDFGDNGTSTNTNTSHTYAADGDYTITLIADAGGCGTDTLIATDTIHIGIPEAPEVESYCTTQNPVSAEFNAQGTGTVTWYSNTTSPTPLYTGNSFTTPTVSTTTAYYVQTTIPNAPQNVPPYSNAFGSGGYFNSPYDEYLEFTVLQRITLNSVRTYSGSAGNKTIKLWNSGGTQLNTIIVNVPAGESVINIGWDLPPGNYRIGGNYLNLYKHGTGVQFPYSLPGVVTITGTSDGPLRYFFFYDWNVTTSCVSPRVPVYVNLNPPHASFTWQLASPQVVNFTSTSTNATSYLWDFGGGNTSTLQNPTHDYQWGGTHYATLTVSNNGCYDTYSTSLEIIGIEEQDELKGRIYPVPFTDQLNFDLELTNSDSQISISLYNLVGQKVADIYNGEVQDVHFTHSWNAGSLAAASYIVKIQYDNKQLVRQVIKH